MTLSINHRFYTAKADGADATTVRPSNWNDYHSPTMAIGNLVGNMAVATSVTVTSASPGVVTWNGHGFSANAPVYFTAAAMPAGLAASTVYFVTAANLLANSFTVSTTPGGTPINTTTTGTTVIGYSAIAYEIPTTGTGNAVFSASPTFTGTLTAAALTVDTNTLYVDSTNHRVGILDATPQWALDIGGNGSAINFFYGNTSAFGANAAIGRIVAQSQNQVETFNGQTVSAAEIKFLTGSSAYYMGQIAFYVNG